MNVYIYRGPNKMLYVHVRRVCMCDFNFERLLSLIGHLLIEGFDTANDSHDYCSNRIGLSR